MLLTKNFLTGCGVRIDDVGSVDEDENEDEKTIQE